MVKKGKTNIHGHLFWLPCYAKHFYVQHENTAENRKKIGFIGWSLSNL